MVEEINDEKFIEVVKEGKVLVDCYATWCGPCRMLSLIIDELASEKEDYKFYKLDVDNSNKVTKEYGIMSIPTLLIFENGELKEKVVGFISKEELEEKL
ncbi:MAG: thioredoxin [Bacilli bacterium]|nr:thioredoxin [Bacilli bacterium]